VGARRGWDEAAAPVEVMINRLESERGSGSCCVCCDDVSLNPEPSICCETQQRCVRGTNSREVAVAAILPISHAFHGGHGGEAGRDEESEGGARGCDDAVTVHARPGQD